MDMSTDSGALRKSYQEDRYYTTRGSVMGFDQHNNGNGEEKGGLVWPRLFISLSSKEKDEDFMAMKGCKLPHRPKKRPKFIQTTLLLVSPGAWLSDLCQERSHDQGSFGVGDAETKRIEGHGEHGD
ncbi:hypothetical protein Scep_013381 [Stephania cephalantha]|uniref:Uncharacterized protein n=1 Tax=Stephania cephalantha TaxID=152367 RepID=A0AAP0P7K8_9MAGN